MRVYTFVLLHGHSLLTRCASFYFARLISHSSAYYYDYIICTMRWLQILAYACVFICVHIFIDCVQCVHALMCTSVRLAVLP